MTRNGENKSSSTTEIFLEKEFKLCRPWEQIRLKSRPYIAHKIKLIEHNSSLHADTVIDSHFPAL